ncbi:ribosomal protein L22 [Aaosphaeria arxii CBS 175.79]|uniref:Ribosomal protein L22 n=1 Tax=Aaosphaeria arxii CBS 175.79 TaxID=1450172 RepID=A0A6A5YCI9_9PLEO|nr:ribosomal protein L22 [Aaosphaeria arxii CBS 175.79]KAF2022420.1 ribosomal protein L22 [Aaosphaeria arxii CBS 175.79]
MSVRIPTRRIGQSALALSRPNTYWITTSRPLSTTVPLSASKDSLRNDLLLDVLRKRQAEQHAAAHGKTTARAPQPEQGNLPSATIFKPEYEIPSFQDSLPDFEKRAVKREEKERRALVARKRDAELSAPKLDPIPRSTKLLERKLVIKSIQKRGRLTKELKLARSERQSLFRSRDLPTSVKKLTKVMNLVQGKTVEEALVQLRFSKKRVAKDVAKGLIIARDQAVIARGMGLGAAQKAETAQDAKTLADGSRIKEKKGKSVTIELKDGKKKEVNDPTEIYVDQAWVGKGQQWKTPEYRARGRVNLLTHRTTSFSVLLKEEKTRVRISEEIAKKRDNRKLWVALPDRPIPSQRQYCLW